MAELVSSRITLSRGALFYSWKEEIRYDAKFKLKVVEFAERHTNREDGRSFSVGKSCVRDWRKAKKKLTEFTSKRSRQPGGGPRPKLQTLKRHLLL